MNKGLIFDILKLNNGIILTLLNVIKIGAIKDNQGFGYFYTLMLAIHKLETSVSIAWRTITYGEENQEIQSSQKGQKSQTPTASA